MSSTEEVKKPKKNTSRLASPQSLGGKKLFNKISKDPMDLILSMAGLEGHSTNFAGKNLQGAKYKDYDLRNSNFEGCDLTNASFINCNLSGCSFVKAIMKNINLDGCRLDGSSFEGARVMGARMRNVVMPRSNLIYAVFDGSDISHSILDDSTINKTSFKKTIMRNTRMRYLRSPIKHNKFVVTFEGADLTAAIIELQSDRIIKIKDATLIGSSLENIIIKDEDLADMDFSRSELTKINFNDVKLNNVNFNSSNISYTKFVRCTLEEIYFNGSESNSLTFVNSKLDRCHFEYLYGNYIIVNNSIVSKCNFSCENREEILSMSFRGKTPRLVGCKISDCTFKTGESELATLEDCLFYDTNITDLVLVTLRNCRFNKTDISDDFQECTIEGCDFEEVKFLDFIMGSSEMYNNTFSESVMNGGILVGSKIVGNDFKDFKFVEASIDNCKDFRENNFTNVLFEKVIVSDSKLIGNTFHNDIVFKSFDIVRSELNNVYPETPQVDQVDITSSNLHSNDAIIFGNAIITVESKEQPSESSSSEIVKSKRKNFPKVRDNGPRSLSSSDSESDSPESRNRGRSSSGKKQVTMHKRRSSSTS